MKRIPLSQGKFALVDDKDYDYLNQWKWYAHKSYRVWYARKTVKVRGVTVLMHREILQCPRGIGSDHINGDGLDNRRTNLRRCTQRQNNRNPHPASGFLGTTLHKSGKWQATVTCKGKCYYLGLYTSRQEAADAHTRKAKKLFGEPDYPNFPKTFNVEKK